MGDESIKEEKASEDNGFRDVTCYNYCWDLTQSCDLGLGKLKEWEGTSQWQLRVIIVKPVVVVAVLTDSCHHQDTYKMVVVTMVVVSSTRY